MTRSLRTPSVPTRLAATRALAFLSVSALVGGLGLAGCSDDVDVVLQNGKLSAQDVDFGDVQIGQTMPFTLELKNIGDGALRVSAIEQGAGFTSPDYEFKATVAPFTLAASGVQTVALSFLPYVEMAMPVTTELRFITDVKDEAGNPVTFTLRLSGRGIKSGLLVEPNPADFGTVLVGSSATREIRITNKLSVPVDVLTKLDEAGRAEIVNQGGLGRFEITSPVKSNGSLLPDENLLAPNASITVEARYVPDPSQEGREDRGRWIIANCDNPLCELPVVLIGRGTNAAIRCVDPDNTDMATNTTLDFKDVNPGVTVTRRVRCENVATEAVVVTGWRLEAGTRTEFSVVPYAGNPSNLASGQSFDVEVQFSPTVAQVGATLSGALVVSGRNPRAARDLSPSRIPLAGRSGGPDISVTPAQLNFGQVAVGTRSKRRILVENTGYSPLEVRMILGDADGTNQFMVDRTSFTVARGSSEVVEVTFTPNVLTEVRSRIVITSDDADEATVEIPVQGVGVDLPPCQYTVTPPSMNFGIVGVQRSTSQGFRIANTGTDACLINDIELAPGSSPAYRLAAGSETGITLPPGEEKTVIVEFTPPMIGNYAAEVTFYISNPTNPNVVIAARGVGADASLLITPNEINFGRIGLGCSTRERTITVYNTGSRATRIVRIEIPAGVSDEFQLLRVPGTVPAPPGAGITINPGASTEFGVRYRARDEGADVGFFHVYEAGRTDPYVVPLYGEGAVDAINEDKFEQLETPQVDILFVIDNSGSMGEEQASLTANFSSFIQFADAQALDYRISVVTTDMEGGLFGGVPCTAGQAQRPNGMPQGACGFFADGNDATQNTEWRWISPNEQPSPEAAFTAIATQGINGSGSETGLAAAYAALSAPIVSGWNQGFLRTDAYLAVIFVSDEEDQSPSAVDFYVNFFKSIKGFRNTALFSASAIVGDAPSGCATAEAGLRYVEVANQTGGIFESICTQSWADSLQNLGLQVFGYKSRFFLGNQPVESSLQVTVDGVRIDRQASSGQVRWSYDVSSNSVNFSPLAIPEPGSEIVVRYRAECL
jgi:hypothetical protein